MNDAASKRNLQRSTNLDSWAEQRIVRSVALRRPVEDARFVNEGRFKLFRRLHIETIANLLHALPFRYLDLTQISSIRAAAIGQDATILATIDKVTKKRTRFGKSIVEVGAVDSSGAIIITFFNQPWVADDLKKGSRVVFRGKVGFSQGLKRMGSPFFEVLTNESEQAVQQRTRMLPIHHATEGLSTSWMRRIISTALADNNGLLDYLPAELRASRHLMSLNQALRTSHFPFDAHEAELARRRAAYDEILCLQLALMTRRDAAVFGLTPTQHSVGGKHMKLLHEAMPFELTSDQKQAVDEILADMREAKIMNRLLLGDVGTGKTAVATHALVACADSQTQGALMAPTGVLALQYAEKIGPLLDQAGVTWALLTGSMQPSERRQILAGLSRGTIDIAFGTHALIQDDVAFRDLSLVIVDEQHRFGVDQRAKLRSKGPGADLLVMTATPIPRTLALAYHGDLTQSVLRTRPNPGAGVATHLLKKGDRGIAYDAIKRAVDAGHQAYVICPLVGEPAQAEHDESAYRLSQGEDPSSLKAAEQEVETLQHGVFNEYRVDLLTGRMKPAQKEQVMAQFKRGEIQILVSTTVVEVGVDVPNATVMMIEDAERFGLAQLHQLRGRVGRGDWPGEVYFVANLRSKKAKERLGLLVQTTDGFELAQADLRLRQEGEIMGQRQHGIGSLVQVDLERDADLIEWAHTDAISLMEQDPWLTGEDSAPLKYEVARRYSDVFTEVSGG